MSINNNLKYIFFYIFFSKKLLYYYFSALQLLYANSIHVIQRIFLRTCLFISLGFFYECSAEYQKNDNTHLSSVLTPMDFYLESIHQLPNNNSLQKVLQLGYIHAIFLLAVTHTLKESKNLSKKEKIDLWYAKGIFEHTIRPFLAGYPISNFMFGTTELWQDLEESRRSYQMMP